MTSLQLELNYGTVKEIEEKLLTLVSSYKEFTTTKEYKDNGKIFSHPLFTALRSIICHPVSDKDDYYLFILCQVIYTNVIKIPQHKVEEQIFANYNLTPKDKKVYPHILKVYREKVVRSYQS